MFAHLFVLTVALLPQSQFPVWHTVAKLVPLALLPKEIAPVLLIALSQLRFQMQIIQPVCHAPAAVEVVKNAAMILPRKIHP